MLTKEENNLVTQTGPGTPCGQLLRSYWQPAALSEELPPGGPPIPLRLFSEDLVMFRDARGQVGLLDLHCSHRGTDLSYGRIEDGGLRCVYHGWLYDVNGQCLETPAEPLGSRLHEYVRHPAYPCLERGGIIFTYMGAGEPSLLPNYEVLSAPPENRLMTKHFLECNWLQGQEGSEDLTHVPFLHRFLQTESGAQKRSLHPSEGTRQSNERSGFGIQRGTGRKEEALDGLGPQQPPSYSYHGPVWAEENDFGVWAYYSSGVAGPEYTYPSLCMTFGGPQAPGDGYQFYWRVPVDDTHHWQFVLSFKRSGPIPDDYRHARVQAIMTPDYHLIRNKANRYLQDREEQRASTFSGMGSVFVPQDTMANEGQGPIQDRTREILGVADMAIAAWRRMLLRAIRTVQHGGAPPGLIRDPRVNAVDPLFLKRNAPASHDELETILKQTRGHWITSLGPAALPV